MKHRGVRLHRVRDFKQCNFNSIPPTSHKSELGVEAVLTLLVYRTLVANHVASCGDPRHDETRIKQTRPYSTSSVRQVVPPNRKRL